MPVGLFSWAMTSLMPAGLPSWAWPGRIWVSRIDRRASNARGRTRFMGCASGKSKRAEPFSESARPGSLSAPGGIRLLEDLVAGLAHCGFLQLFLGPFLAGGNVLGRLDEGF